MTVAARPSRYTPGTVSASSTSIDACPASLVFLNVERRRPELHLHLDAGHSFVHTITGHGDRAVDLAARLYRLRPHTLFQTHVAMHDIGSRFDYDSLRFGVNDLPAVLDDPLDEVAGKLENA